MIRRHLILIAASLTLSGVVTAKVPDEPRPKGNKFAVEMFRIDSPQGFDKDKFKQDNESIEQLFNSKENRVKAYPVVYAEQGKTAVSDQTTSMMLPEDYNVVNGKLIPVERLQRIGVRSEVTVTALRNNSATFNLKFHHQEIKGYDEYKLKGDHNARIPHFETRKVDTELTQVLGSWVVVGGIESVVDEQVKTAYYIVRVTRPSSGFGSRSVGSWQSL